MSRRLTTEEILRHFRSTDPASSRRMFSPGRNPKRTTHYLVPYRNGHRHAVVTYLKTPSSTVREYPVAYLAIESAEIPAVMASMTGQDDVVPAGLLLLEDGSEPTFCCSAGVIQQPPSRLVGLAGVESDRHYVGWDWMEAVHWNAPDQNLPDPRTIATWMVNASRSLDQFITGTTETLTASDEFYPYYEIDVPE